MARIPADASAQIIQQCVKNAQAAVAPGPSRYDQRARILETEDGITNLGDAIIALTNQVKMLTNAVQQMEGQHVVRIDRKTESKLRLWIE